MTNEMVRAMIAYREQKTKIKAKQRSELNESLIPWAKTLGKTIIEARDHGMTIQEIADTIGLQNRSFIYEMIRAAKPEQEQEQEAVVSEATVSASTPEYTILYYDGAAVVSFDAYESYEVMVIDGVPDVPEEWSEHSAARRALYKKVIQEIKNHDWN